MERYHEHYLLLGIHRGDSWPKLRHAYKVQMRRWHPDRYTDSETDKRKAEERTKQINQAYQELADFYNQHGRLPLDAPTHIVETTSDAVPDAPAEPVAARPSAASEVRRQRLRRGSAPGLILSVVLTATVGYLLWGSKDVDRGHIDISQSGSIASTDTKPTESHTVSNTLPDTNSGWFGIGSTLGEVYSIEGVPTRVDGDTWYYGNAQVYFQNGKVVCWADTDPPQLKTDRSLGSSPVSTPPATVFTRGSTKDEVRALQGVPLHESTTVWDYGLSRVYFDASGHVSSWQESPLAPLRVTH